MQDPRRERPQQYPPRNPNPTPPTQPTQGETFSPRQTGAPNVGSVPPIQPQPNQYPPQQPYIEEPPYIPFGDERTYDPYEQKPTKASRIPKIGNKNLLLIVMSAVIAAVICYMMIPRIAPTRVLYDEDIGRIEGTLGGAIASIDGHTAQITGLTTDVTGLKVLPGQLSSLSGRVDGQAASISSLQSSVSGINSQLATGLKEPLEYSLSGMFGNFTLTATSKTAGNFTALVTVVYNAPYIVAGENYTDAVRAFFDGLGSHTTSYMPELAWSGNVSSGNWTVVDVAFYSVKFPLLANNATPVSIVFSGLKSGGVYENMCYVEVFPVI